MQKMAIFQGFSRSFRENSLLAKAMNNFTISGGYLRAYPQAKSGNGLNIFNEIAAESKNARKVGAQRSSYLANCSKNPEVPPCFRGERHHYIHTLRYNNFGLFAPLGREQTAAQLPVHARRFYSREKVTKTTPDRNRNIRDHKRRLLAAKYELRRKLYKALCQDPELPPAMREKHHHKLSKLPRNSSFTRVRNRCIFTGRGRAVYRKFRISRICFRKLAGQGQLTGVRKASW
ncbi:Sdh2-1p [Orobanche minor]